MPRKRSDEPSAPGPDPLLRGPPEEIVAALRRIMRPVVRLLIAHGITLPFMTSFLKSLYVETAAEEFALGGRRPTDSRLTLLTGVHRKDIRRLLREPAPASPTPPGLTLGTLIVARWLSDPAYVNRRGIPRALPRTPSHGGDLSFAALVESVSKNVRARSVLDELARLGVVRIDELDYVHLVTRGFVPAKELAAKAFYFGEAMRDHLAAGVQNLRGGTPPELERSVYYTELTPASVALLRETAERLGMKLLQDINREGMALEKSDPPDPAQRKRMRFGIYFHAEDVPPPPPPPEGKPKR